MTASIAYIVFFIALAFANEDNAEQNAQEAPTTSAILPPIENGILYENIIFYRQNPFGIGDLFRIGYKKKIGNKPSNDPLFGKNNLYSGFERVVWRS